MTDRTWIIEAQVPTGNGWPSDQEIAAAVEGARPAAEAAGAKIVAGARVVYVHIPTSTEDEAESRREALDLAWSFFEPAGFGNIPFIPPRLAP